jgi:hypothetical protein
MACFALGCASDHRSESNELSVPRASGSQTEGGATDESSLAIAFNPMYSAYDEGQHTFRVPVRVLGAEDEHGSVRLLRRARACAHRKGLAGPS